LEIAYNLEFRFFANGIVSTGHTKQSKISHKNAQDAQNQITYDCRAERHLPV